MKLKNIGPFTMEHEGPWITRDGREARVICKDMKGEWSVIALVGSLLCGDEMVSLHLKSGKTGTPGRDLFNAEYVKEPRVIWVNEYPHGGISVHETKSGAILDCGDWAERMAVRYIESPE